jgi:RNA polymerase sigma-70 factor (ECF subfamily)
VDHETRFREVFELAYAPLCRYARHRGLTGQDAEDLVAQTLEIAWRRIADVPAAEPLPWLYAVARNVWRNTTRRELRRRELLARFWSRPPNEAGPDTGGMEPGVMRAALSSLSSDDQEILRLVAWDGLAPAQLAVVLGCSPAAARTRLHRARSRLANRLGITDLKQRAVPGHKQGNSHGAVEVQ